MIYVFADSLYTFKTYEVTTENINLFVSLVNQI